MNNKIVVIDDEAQIRRMLKVALSSDGYVVTGCGTGQEGITAVARQQPDLVILDLGLPDLDGQDVLKAIREWSRVPVIVLSVRDHESMKVLALDEGAQDYVTKPFSIIELLARVRACLRDLSSSPESPIKTDGKLSIDLSARRVCLGENTIEFTPKEYNVLALLSKSPNRVVTQSQILQQVWGPGHEDDTHYLRIIISHIRQKLGDDPLQPTYVITEPGVGYRFCLDQVSDESLSG
ncbi:DNA-binding response regulator [Salinivibrio sp. MA351]|uniref:response regulator n=1 Tax=Salinivibrio sp. MA351 TaxID=1909453 RepID=UPI0009899E35|nr:response regulator [Salinivibrio sp. MA351]OOE97429.1 DNA-binding response regulator [Salinivibrio sp. MA351]